MAISYPEILGLRSEGHRSSWTSTDALTYALAIGMGADPMNRQELDYVYEKNQKPIPTLAGVIARGGGPGATGVNYLMVVDGERKIEFHQPMAVQGEVIGSSRVIGAWDKGEGRGAVIISQTELRDASSGKLVLTIEGSTFARGDGGFGGPSTGQPEPHKTPTRSPDLSVDIPTRPDQALLYRLTGDRNPLHCDPDVAAKAGYSKPILHGMCTYGVTCRAVLQTYADYDADAFKSHQARFSSPVYPGETITVDLWRDGSEVSFEARVRERGVTVIKNGKTVLG